MSSFPINVWLTYVSQSMSSSVWSFCVVCSMNLHIIWKWSNKCILFANLFVALSTSWKGFLVVYIGVPLVDYFSWWKHAFLEEGPHLIGFLASVLGEILSLPPWSSTCGRDLISMRFYLFHWRSYLQVIMVFNLGWYIIFVTMVFKSSWSII